VPARPVSGTSHTGHSHSRLDHTSALANRNATNTPYGTVIVPGTVPGIAAGRSWRTIADVDVDADRLTQALAGRLAAIVPEGFGVEASDGMLWYSADRGRFPGQRGDYRTGTAGTHVRFNFSVLDQAVGERLVRVAAQALSELQDYVDEATHEPWPGERTPPQACAEIRDAALRLWYGDPGAGGRVVLGCDPIPLADLRPGG
jgi:hypothetical protein